MGGQSDKAYAGASIPENYDRVLVPILFEDYGQDLAAEVDVPPGGALLEIACGTGALTRHLNSRLPANAHLIVSDLAPAMVEICRSNVGDAEHIDFQIANAADLPFGNESFEGVACQFSVMLFPERETAYAEVHRVLKPGGQFLFNVWDRLEENPFCRAVHVALRDIYPDDPPGFLEAPFSYHDPSQIEKDLHDAGFTEVDIDRCKKTSNAPSARAVAVGLMQGSPLALELEERTDPDPEKACEIVAHSLAEEFGNGAVAVATRAYRVIARKPM